MTNVTPPHVNTWESARRAQLPKIALTLVLAAIFIFLAADEIGDLAEAERAAAWGRFLVVATLTLISSTTFFAYSTLRGPAFEQDPERRQAQQARNRILGGLVFGLVWVLTVIWIRDLLMRLPLIPLYAASSGVLAGMFFGVAGVWYLHHRRGSWPPDREVRR